MVLLYIPSGVALSWSEDSITHQAKGHKKSLGNKLWVCFVFNWVVFLLLLSKLLLCLTVFQLLSECTKYSLESILPAAQMLLVGCWWTSLLLIRMPLRAASPLLYWKDLQGLDQLKKFDWIKPVCPETALSRKYEVKSSCSLRTVYTCIWFCSIHRREWNWKRNFERHYFGWFWVVLGVFLYS